MCVGRKGGRITEARGKERKRRKRGAMEGRVGRMNFKKKKKNEGLFIRKDPQSV